MQANRITDMPVVGVNELVAAVRACSARAGRPVLAIDGRSGSGKSTVAEALARVIDAVLVPCDDFFAASVTDAEWESRSPDQGL